MVARRRQKALRWIVGLCGAFLFATLLCEIGLRLTLGLGSPLLYRIDTAVGYLPVPNQHLKRFGAQIDINAEGMRCAELPATRPAADLRILAVGDSVTFGTTRLDQAQIFTTRLQQQLAMSMQRPVEVLNMSAGGWAIANEAAFIHDRGTFDADMVLLVINTGDLVQPFNTLKPVDATGYPQRAPLSAISELLTRYVGPRLFPAAASADAGSIAAAAPDALNELPPILVAIDRLRRQVVGAGERLILVFIPARSADWQQPGYVAALDALKKWASEHELPLWDLTPEMSARPMGELYQDGIHPNAAGHAVIAERLKQEVMTFKR